MKLFRSPRRTTTPVRPHKPCLRCEVLEDRMLLSGVVQGFARPDYVIHHPLASASPLGSPGPTGYSPAQIIHAYAFDQVAFPGGVKGDGSGTTIAIVDAFADPYVVHDLHQFDAQFNLPDPTISVVDQRGGNNLPSPDPGWASEIVLDVEWSHAIAPGAKILLVEADDNSFNSLLTAVSFAAGQPGVVAVSMSWGGGEDPSETGFDSTFTTPSGHAGVTFVAASGDFGAPPGFPAISPNVLAAGGTTLNLDSQGTYLSESGWAGSGGGISAYENQPGYQNGVVTQDPSFRANPDVAYDSDPNTGFPVYDSYNNGDLAPWSQFGGTSAASPQWAALIAIADQGRILAGKSVLDGVSQTLPMLYKLPAADFHDIITGSSQGFPPYDAGPGYDLVTGLGTPIANKVVGDLVGLPAVTHFTVSAPAGSTAGSAFSVAVTALDQNNKIVTGYTGAVHFTSSDGSAVLPANYTFVAGDNGVHTFTNAVTLKKAGSQTITVADASASAINGSATISVSAAVANSIGFGQQPANSVAGAAISPAVTVQVLDLYGNVVTTDQTHAVTMAIGSNAGNGTLSGTTSVTVASGVATFSTLSINKTGAGYTLKASSGSLGSAASGAFNITPGKASKLAFGQQPTNTPAGTSITPTVTVQVLDVNGNLVTGDNSDAVTIGLGANPSGGSLSGTLTVTAKSGVASFSDLAVSKTGNGFTLTAGSGILTGTACAPFNVTPPGTHLVFNQQPTTATAGTAIAPAITVDVLDAANNIVTTDNSDKITIVLAANPGNGTLGGTITITVSAGVAKFSDLSIKKTGTGYTFKASTGKLTAATSAPFTITPAKVDHLGFGQQPANTVAGNAISPAVTVQVFDSFNNLVTTDNTDVLALAIGANPGGGTLIGATSVTVANGVATYSTLSIDKTGAGYTLKASSGSLGGATSGTFNISPGKADHLAFGQQPTTTYFGAAITPAVTVQVFDVNNNLVTGDNTDVVSLKLANNPTGATLAGATTATASGGVATFSNLSVNLAGTGYALGASSGSLNPATSASFDITDTILIEDFEKGLSLYHARLYGILYTKTASIAAHDGKYGLYITKSPGWIYRNDAAARVQQGDTISTWVQLASVADGRAYFGFGATATGTLSLVLAPNTGELIIEDNPGYNFVDLAAVSQSYKANHWYRAEVNWGTNGTITGRLFDSDGKTLLKSVQAKATDITTGGIAFRGTDYTFNKYFDTVTLKHGGSMHSVGLDDGGAKLNGPRVATDANADVATAGTPGQRSAGQVGGTVSPARDAADFLFLSYAPSVPAFSSPAAALSSTPMVSLPMVSAPDSSVRLAPVRQESGAGNDTPTAMAQDQDTRPVMPPDGVFDSSDVFVAPKDQDITGHLQKAARASAWSDAYFARMDLSSQDQGELPPLPEEVPAFSLAAEGGSAIAIVAIELGFTSREVCGARENARRRPRRHTCRAQE